MAKSRTEAAGAPFADLARFATGASTWITGALGTSAVVFVVALLFATGQLLGNRHTVRVLPLPGVGTANQAETAIELTEILAAVAGGASSGVGADDSIAQVGTGTAPAVAIPGTSIQLATVFEFLEGTWLGAQDRVRVAEASNGSGQYVIRVQLDGWATGGRTLTAEPKSTPGEALLDGAERIFAVLKPGSAAYYFATRYPDRSLELVERIVRDPNASDAERSAAFRASAIVLRDQGDQEGARARLLDAYGSAPSDAQRAGILVDTGYTFGVDEHWADAERAYQSALAITPRWALAKSRLAFAQLQQARLAEADATFAEAARLDRYWAEPLRGRAQVARRRWDPWTAMDFYRVARRNSFAVDDRTLVDREIGDLYVEIGCVAEGRALHRQAATIAGCYDGPGAKLPCSSVLGGGEPPCALLALAPPPTS